MAEAVTLTQVTENTDLIESTAISIMYIPAKNVTTAARNYTDQNAFHAFELGGCLSRVYNEKLWQAEGYSKFKDFVEDIGLHYRKGMYLMDIYDKLVASDIPWNKVSHLGWTKLRELAHVINTSNVDSWVEVAEKNNVVALAELVREFRNKNSTPDSEESYPVSTMTFKVHEDQKETIDNAIAQASKELNTEYPTVALEAICLNYLSGANVTKQVGGSLVTILRDYGPEDVAEAVDAAFPDIDFTMVLK